MLVGRQQEKEILKESLLSQKAELIAVYGRRRIGKTFLIREYFKQHLIFEVTGLFNGDLHDQLENFTKEFKKRVKKNKLEKPEKWSTAFQMLEEYINQYKSKKKKVIFIDEFPWIATPKSKFLMAFENFWNHFASRRKDLIVVICGSAASFMTQKIIQNKGGLHNRITRIIRLLPFNITETSQFLKSRNILYTEYDIVQLYMAIGGIPHYLDKLHKGKSVAQNIDQLFFDKKGALYNEFKNLFTSLFDDSEKHYKIIKTLSLHQKGLTRQNISSLCKINSGGDLSLKLNELSESGFISEYNYFGNKKQLTLYKLSDEFCLFHLRFITRFQSGGHGSWIRLAKSSSYQSWCGFAFESLCLKHIYQIKRALRIDAIYSTNSSWFNKDAQIDLLIDRDDHIINICEMKFYNKEFVIDKRYYHDLKRKIQALLSESKTTKNIFITMITTYGVKENSYKSELVKNELTLDLFFSE